MILNGDILQKHKKRTCCKVPWSKEGEFRANVTESSLGGYLIPPVVESLECVCVCFSRGSVDGPMEMRKEGSTSSYANFPLFPQEPRDRKDLFKMSEILGDELIVCKLEPELPEIREDDSSSPPGGGENVEPLSLLSFHPLASPLPDVIPLLDYSSPMDLVYGHEDYDRLLGGDTPLATQEDRLDEDGSTPPPGLPPFLKPSRRKRSFASEPLSNVLLASKKGRRKPISQDELLVQRNQANVRERQRTQSLNLAFQNLRQIIPTRPCDKLSKIQTLKLASCYINFLWQILKESVELEDNEDLKSVTTKRENLSYAFTLWRMQGEYRDTINSSSSSSTDHEEASHPHP
ncbi:Twistrelated protein 2like [Caligus rogercresseyi]|uniref:Twistrelated protein 2like n=1 Tax=Caligus rogercresseyi TaxID=217165 RepID=A0A7T8KI27_CALRO|nr:Twistrelated protein 2like [Caligus rogercresseyi]